jgi:hypothetical protein
MKYFQDVDVVLSNVKSVPKSRNSIDLSIMKKMSFHSNVKHDFRMKKILKNL